MGGFEVIFSIENWAHHEIFSTGLRAQEISFRNFPTFSAGLRAQEISFCNFPTFSAGLRAGIDPVVQTGGRRSCKVVAIGIF